MITKDEDSATYTCVATNVAGKDMYDIALEVFSSPHITDGNNLQNIDVIINDPFTLECNAKGFPKPDIEVLDFT